MKRTRTTDRESQLSAKWDDPAVFAELEQIERDAQCVLCVSARDLGAGQALRYNSGRKCKTASTIKLPMLAHFAMSVAEGKRSWSETLTLTEAEKVAGSGVLTQMTAGLQLTLRDVCVLMTIVSDNTATNMLIELEGVGPINARLRSLGLPLTTLFRKSYTPDTEESREFGLGMTTPDEMAELVQMLAEGRVGGAAVSEEILGILAGQCLRDSIPRGLPEEWSYAGKTGGVDGVRNDVGLVTAPDGSRYALAIYCQDLRDLRWSLENAGLVAIGRVARALLPAG